MIVLAVALVLGFYLGNKFPFWFALLQSAYEKRKVMNAMLPKKLDPSKICRGPHWWLEAAQYTEQGDKPIKICSVCGFIQGTRTAATQEAIDKIEETIRHREIEDKLYKEFEDKEAVDIRKYFSKEIENGLDFDKLQKLFNAGLSYKQRYAAYRVSKNTQFQKELTRANA